MSVKLRSLKNADKEAWDTAETFVNSKILFEDLSLQY